MLATVSGLTRPVSFFDAYHQFSPFKTVLDDTARAWAYAQDIDHNNTQLSADDYQVCIYTLIGMVTCLHKSVGVMPMHSIADDEKSYYIRLIHYFENDCYTLSLTMQQRTIMQELFAGIQALLIKTNDPKFSARQYQSSYTYWQYPKKSLDCLQYRLC